MLASKGRLPDLKRYRLPQASTPTLQTVGSYRLVSARWSRRACRDSSCRSERRLRPVAGDVATLTRLMMAAGIVILFVAPLSGYLLAGRATRPLARIITTAGAAAAQPHGRAVADSRHARRARPAFADDQSLSRLVARLPGAQSRVRGQCGPRAALAAGRRAKLGRSGAQQRPHRRRVPGHALRDRRRVRAVARAGQPVAAAGRDRHRRLAAGKASRAVRPAGRAVDRHVPRRRRRTGRQPGCRPDQRHSRAGQRRSAAASDQQPDRQQPEVHAQRRPGAGDPATARRNGKSSCSR